MQFMISNKLSTSNNFNNSNPNKKSQFNNLPNNN